MTHFTSEKHFGAEAMKDGYYAISAHKRFSEIQLALC